VSNLRAVLFDADGVLIAPPELYSLRVAHNHGVEERQLMEFFGGPFLDCLCGTADLKHGLSPYLDAWGWTDGGDGYIDAWLRSEHVVDQSLAGSIAGLSASGIACYLATNQEPYRLQYILRDMAFEAMFDGIICSCRLGVSKPDVEFFRRAWLSMDRLEPGQALFWDDRQGNVDAARSFGLQAELYTSFEDFCAKMEHYLP
jgi:HAD superfamily hydrolase (TIGR01509 family)